MPAWNNKQMWSSFATALHVAKKNPQQKTGILTYITMSYQDALDNFLELKNPLFQHFWFFLQPIQGYQGVTLLK